MRPPRVWFGSGQPGQPSPLLQGLQKLVALTALETALRTPPIQQLADRVGQLSQRQIPEIAGDLTDELNLIGPKRLPAEGKTFPNDDRHRRG